MEISYEAQGVCARIINVQLEGNIIKHIEIIGGCPGNTEGYSRLLPGMDAEYAIERLEGIPCKTKVSSCPDQLAKALRKCLECQAAEKVDGDADIPEIENPLSFIERIRAWFSK